MKAKDYAKKYNDNPDVATLAEICNLFLSETHELIESRHAKSNSACMAVLKELDQKWIAFSRMVPDVKRDGYKIIIDEIMPGLIVPMGWTKEVSRAKG